MKPFPSAGDAAPAATLDAGSGDGALPALTPSRFALGLNADGMEYSEDTVPGVGGTNYALISNAELDTYHARGLDLIRLPLAWTRMQPTIDGDLNTTYVSQVKAVCEHAATNSQTVIVDIHAFGGRDGHQIGDGTLTTENFTNLWTKLATQLKGQAGIAGYDIMNEPSHMPNAAAWPTAAQAAIDAIRAVDPDVTLYIEGDSWSSADKWVSVNPTFPLADPSAKIIYSAHAYADSDASGTHFTWSVEAAAGVTTDTLTTRISHFATWCEAHAVPCHIGESGVGNDDPNWNVTLDKALAYSQAHGLQFTYWAGGPWWPSSYASSIEPDSAPQLTVIAKYVQ